jgi:hypothetical protein
MSGRGHIETVRAIVFVLPLAVLAGSVLAPPDPFAQLVLMGLTLAIGVPVSRRVLALATYRPLRIGAFYLVVSLVVLGGLLALSAVSIDGELASTVARTVVVVMGLVAGYWLILAGTGR